MKKLNPQKMIDHVVKMQRDVELSKKLVVAVGLPLGESARDVYDTGASVIEVGAGHEYGVAGIPQRSFLRTPFSVKQKQIQQMLEIAYAGVFEQGHEVKTQLAKVGAGLKNISLKSWETNGYGTWPALSAKTIEAKGSDKPLLDTGLLRQSITYVVRDAA